ncbi:hypothetical protein, partial [Bradyrhizobium sp.]|uniref:hypothetical protein n=1 Tax=Bradyrhizobium sp. TaxID=376 RepID=UPI003C59193A
LVLRHRRVHRTPHQRFVTIAKRPSRWARDGRASNGDLPDVTSENVCGELTRRANQVMLQSSLRRNVNTAVFYI